MADARPSAHGEKRGGEKGSTPRRERGSESEVEGVLPVGVPRSQ